MKDNRTNELTGKPIPDTIKVLMVEPGKYPKVKVIKNTIESMHKAIGCDTIDILPLGRSVALVIDDVGLTKNRALNRYIPELRQPIAGPFFISGEEAGELTDLSEELIEKFTEQFQHPEEIIISGSMCNVVRMDHEI